jgi:outer membrane immunogenic protein
MGVIMYRVSLSAAAIAAIFAGIPSALADNFSGYHQTNWTGFYVGGHAGVIVDGGATYTYTTQPASNFEPPNRPRPTDMEDEAIYGIQGGYLHQFGWLVAGVEGSISFGDAEGILRENPPPGNDYVTKTEMNEIYAISGRLGVAHDRFFVYGKVGYAWTEFDFSAQFNNFGPPSVTRISNTFETEGAVYGGGVEFALTEHVTIGAEDLRYDFGSEGATLVATNTGINPETLNADFEIDVVQARLNFKFGDDRRSVVPLK